MKLSSKVRWERRGDLFPDRPKFLRDEIAAQMAHPDRTHCCGAPLLDPEPSSKYLRRHKRKGEAVCGAAYECSAAYKRLYKRGRRVGQ